MGHLLPYFPKLAAHFGFDGIWVDGEHRAFDPREAQALIAFHQLADIDCIWRAATLEKTGLYRLLEDGATGLMIPHVSTPEKARALAEAVKFPPIGDRGIDGAGLDSGFYVGSGSSYLQDVNEETFLVVQIETPRQWRMSMRLPQFRGSGCCSWGQEISPLRLKCGDGVEDSQMMAAQRKVASAAKKHGKAWGRPVSSGKDAKFIQEMGGQFIALGNEFQAVYSHLQQCAAQFDQALGQKPPEPAPSEPIIPDVFVSQGP